MDLTPTFFALAGRAARPTVEETCFSGQPITETNFFRRCLAVKVGLAELRRRVKEGSAKYFDSMRKLNMAVLDTGAGLAGVMTAAQLDEQDARDMATVQALGARALALRSEYQAESARDRALHTFHGALLDSLGCQLQRTAALLAQRREARTWFAVSQRRARLIDDDMCQALQRRRMRAAPGRLATAVATSASAAATHLRSFLRAPVAALGGEGAGAGTGAGLGPGSPRAGGGAKAAAAAGSTTGSPTKDGAPLALPPSTAAVTTTASAASTPQSSLLARLASPARSAKDTGATTTTTAYGPKHPTGSRVVATVPVEDLSVPATELLVQERALLQRKANSVAAEMRAAEERVTEISRLQSIISTNLAVQAEAIDSIYSTCVEAAENITRGNEYLQSSAERIKSGTWNMFLFIMMCNFCLVLFHLIA